MLPNQKNKFSVEICFTIQFKHKTKLIFRKIEYIEIFLKINVTEYSLIALIN